MSSHHIVREKQEPALLVLGLDSFPHELLGQLLEWSPTIIATTETAEKLITNGIKIDWVITNGLNDISQSDVKLMSAGTGNLTDAALTYLSENDYLAVNIIADELDLAGLAPFADRLNLVIFHNDKKIYAVSTGFSKWKQAGEAIEFLTHSDNLYLTGLQQTDDLQYKTTGDGFISLQFNEPFLFIAELL